MVCHLISLRLDLNNILMLLFGLVLCTVLSGLAILIFSGSTFSVLLLIIISLIDSTILTITTLLATIFLVASLAVICHVGGIQEIHLWEALKFLELIDHGRNVTDTHVHLYTDSFVSLAHHGTLVHIVNIV